MKTNSMNAYILPGIFFIIPIFTFPQTRTITIEKKPSFHEEKPDQPYLPPLNRKTSLPKSIQDEIFDFTEFLIQKDRPKMAKIHPKAGCMQGVFKMRKDFNEPLDDFNEYMK